MSRAESIGTAMVLALASAVIIPYLLDIAGFGLMPIAYVVISTAIALVIVFMHRHAITARSDILVFAATVAVTLGTLLWLARPELLPPGGGPDLTHHLLLTDY